MKIILILGIIVVVLLIIKACIAENRHNNTSRPSMVPPSQKSENDKIVVIKGAKYDDVQKAITQFCNIYNQQEFIAIPNLTKIADDEFVVTFPYDLGFDTFCFFINYMYYPEEIFYKADIKAWATTKLDDIWIADKSANKKVMLYIPSDDKEYDNVYLTTEDNIGYKLGFAAGEAMRLLDIPKISYIRPTVTIDSLNDKAGEEIR